MASTIYDVRVQYLLDDKASRGLASIGKNAEKSASGVGSLSSGMRKLMVLGAGFLTFRAGKKGLIDYNTQMEQAKIQMEGLLSLNLGGSFARNQERANFLMKRFRDDAKASVGTTEDFVNMGSMLTGPLTRAGASMQDIADITKGAVVASRAFGVESEFAARDIEQALAGTLGQKDRFARALLEPMGLTTKAWNEMVRKTPAKAAEMLTKAFKQDALMQMAKRQEKSFAGLWSTVEDNLQRVFGQVGIPLMEAMSAEMERLVAWFDQNPEKITKIAADIGEGLVKAFKVVKEVFAFIGRNKEMLLMVGALFGVGKGVGGIVSAIDKTFSATNTGLMSFGAKLNMAAAGLSALYFGARAAADFLLARQESKIAATSANPLLKEQARLLGGGKVSGGTYSGSFSAARRTDTEGFGKFGANEVYLAKKVEADARAAKLVGENGRADMAALAKSFDISGFNSGRVNNMLEGGRSDVGIAMILKESGNAEEMRMAEFLIGLDRAMEINRQAQERGIGSIVTAVLGKASDQQTMDKNGDMANDRGKSKGKSETNVKISKIEVVSDDPDRFAFNLVGAMKRFNKSPTQAKRAVSER